MSLRAEEPRAAGQRLSRGAGGDATRGAGARTEISHILSVKKAKGKGAGYLTRGSGVQRRDAERLCYDFPDRAEVGRPCGIPTAACV